MNAVGSSLVVVVLAHPRRRRSRLESLTRRATSRRPGARISRFRYAFTESWFAPYLSRVTAVQQRPSTRTLYTQSSVTPKSTFTFTVHTQTGLLSSVQNVVLLLTFGRGRPAALYLAMNAAA